MRLFYQSNISSLQELSDDDSKHCIKVLRMKAGDVIHVVDGAGGLYTCRILNENHKKCRIEILEKKEEWQKPQRNIHIAVAPTKNRERVSHFVEKAVEIGISEISFVVCDNSERVQIKTERLERVAISAMKQSLKAYLPKINPVVTLPTWIKNCEASQKFVAHLSQDSKLLTECGLGDSLAMAIGPEGDFSDDEIELFQSSGFKVVTLGSSRLRTETAALVSVTLLNLIP